MRIYLQSSRFLRLELLVAVIMYMSIGSMDTVLPSVFAQSSVQISDSWTEEDQLEYLSKLGVSDENLLKLTKRISLHFEDADVKLVLKYIADQAGLTLAYNSAVWEKEEAITLNIDEIPVLDALFGDYKEHQFIF